MLKITFMYIYPRLGHFIAKIFIGSLDMCILTSGLLRTPARTFVVNRTFVGRFTLVLF